MEEAFKRFPSVEITADAIEPYYKVKFIECVSERGSIRFETRKGRVPKEDLQRLVEELVGKVRIDGR